MMIHGLEERGDCSRGSAARAVGLLGCVLLVAGLLAATPAVAGTSGQLCIKEKIGGNPPCTANDVRVGTLEVVGEPQACTPGEDVTVLMEATIESGPDRYAIGIWINETGGSAQSDPGGTCYRDFLTPVDESLGNDGCDQQGGPYYDGDGDGDACGDVYAQNTDPCGNAVTAPCTGGAGGTCLFTTYQFTATFECADSDGDGMADVGACTSWDNKVVGTCIDELDTDPGTGSKCSCDIINIGDLFFGCREDSECDDGVECTDDVCTIEGNVGTCSNPPVANSTPCEDGNACTSETGAPETPDHCFEGVCTGIPVSCPGDQCNTGVCDPDTGACGLVPLEDSTPCEDGDACTSETGAEASPDHCVAGECVGVPVACGPGDQCNDDVCDPATGTCELVPKADSTPCEDGSYCTSETGAPGTPDHCESGVCVGIPVDCGPGDQCNDDVCNEATDACEVVPKEDSTPCEDGYYCTSFGGVPGDADHCLGGTCTGDPVDCGPGDQCNDDVCDENTDACIVVPKAESTPCDDPFFCTSFGGVPGDRDHCDGAGNCVGDPVDCDDGFVCTDDTCNEGTDQCDNDWICNQPSISITYLGLVFDSTTMLSGGWGISNESEEPGVEVVVSEFDLLVEVRFGNKGPWREVAATCTFNPEAPVAIPEDDYNDSTAELVGTYMCTLDDATLESGDGVRVTLEATILDRAKVFKYRTSMTY